MTISPKDTKAHISKATSKKLGDLALKLGLHKKRLFDLLAAIPLEDLKQLIKQYL